MMGLFYREFEDLRIEALVTGCVGALRGWLGRVLCREELDVFVEKARRAGVDPLGENGEYHTLVVNTKLHSRRLSYKIAETARYGDYYIVRVV